MGDRAVVVGFLLLASLARPAAAQVTGAFLDSPPGEPIGDGQQYSYDASTTFTSSAAIPDRITVGFDGWSVRLVMPAGATFAAGNYESAVRTGFLHGRPQIGVTRNGACVEASGWFRVHEVQVAAGAIAVLAVDFLQSCDGGPPLYGAVRINSSLPVQRTQPYARAPSPQHVVEGSTVALDATNSFGRVAGVTAYAWAQVAGPAVALGGASTVTASFVAPPMATGSSQSLVFRLTATASDGQSDVIDVTVRNHDVNAPRTRAIVESEPGEWVGQGKSYSYDEEDAVIFAGISFDELVIEIHSSERWIMWLRMPDGGDWRPGMYPLAEDPRNGRQDRAGLSFFGEGRASCSPSMGTTIGWLEVIEVTTVGDQVPTLAVDFARTCPDAPPLFGAIRINSGVPVDRNQPYAVAGLDTVVLGGRPVELDGSQSFARAGTRPLQYSWSQVSGPSAEILNPAGAVTGIVPAAGSGNMVFELTVTDTLGRIGTDQVTVYGSGDRQDYLLLDSEFGDSVGLGQEWFYTGDSSGIGGGTFVSHLNSGAVGSGISAEVFADEDPYGDWSLVFASEGPRLGTGAYENAIKHSSSQAVPAAMDVRRGMVGSYTNCTSISGRFEVLSLAYNSGGGLESAAIDFEQHCDGATAALFGYLRFNVVPATLPVARAGQDQALEQGAAAALDGSASSDDGSITAYHWTQFGGPPVTLAGNNTATPSVAVLPPGPAELEFRLQVTDDSGNVGFDTVIVTVGDSDFDDDGVRNSIEARAPGGDGNGDGIPDALQPGVRTFVDHSGAMMTLEAGTGMTIAEATGIANPDRADSPPGVSFDRGFLVMVLEVAPGASATVSVWLHGAPRPTSFWKYSHVTASFYEFLFDGVTGAEILDDHIVLHFVDGGRGDHDGIVNGRIVDPGAPGWPRRFSTSGGLGTSLLAGLLFAGLLRRRRR